MKDSKLYFGKDCVWTISMRNWGNRWPKPAQMAGLNWRFVIEISFKLSGTNLPEVVIDHINQFPAFI